MPKKGLCLTLWGHITHVLDKISPHTNKVSSSSCSTHSGLTATTTHGRTMDQSQPHHKQQQEHYSTPQEEQVSSRQEQQQHRQQTLYHHQQHFQPLSSPHCQQIQTPYRHVYYSSTLSLNVRSTPSLSFSSSCTSLSSTFNSTSIASMQDSQYESLWEVQLALREIPGMIEGNILESCHQEEEGGSSAGSGAASMPSSLQSPLPLERQPHFQSFSSSIVRDAQPQAISPSLRRTFATMDSFPRFPSPSAFNDDDGCYSESDENDEEEEEVENFTLQRFLQQPLQPHSLLQSYNTPYKSAWDNSDHYNTTPSFLSTEPQSSRNNEEDKEEGKNALTYSQRQFRGNYSDSATLLNDNASDDLLANTGATNSHSLSSNPRSDRKDSGVFFHDAEDGTIVKMSPRAIFSFSSSASESESEADAEHNDCSYLSGGKNSDLRSRWMNGVTCTPTNSNTNTKARDDVNRGSKTTLRRRECISSTSISSPSPFTTSTVTTLASVTTTATSTFPSLMAAVSFISSQA